jgi:GNAT superfamily N-acetyltransferase
MAAPDNSTTFSGDVWAELRLADARDVPHIYSLIHQMAEFELLTDLFAATEELLTSTLFPSPAPPPFASFTALVLELSPSPAAAGSSSTIGSLRLDLSASPLADPEAPAFASPRGGGRVTAGFVICFPNYSSFLSKPGLYVEDIFVRAPWRRRGLGRMMLSSVAGRAAELGMGRVEWCVLDWNKNAIDFYEGMGADVLPQWRICRLTGAALDKYKGNQEAAAADGKAAE